MNSTLYTYKTLSIQQKKEFFDFLKEASIETKQRASNNMWDDSWESMEHTLPYILEKTDRFNNDNGEFHIVLQDNKIVACGGVYISSFSRDVGLAGTRTWVHRDFRNKLIIRELLLPAHKEWCIAHQCKAVGICFNDYNKNLIVPFKRTRLNEDPARLVDRKPHHLFFNGVTEVLFPVTIQYTKQWISYEKIDTTWNFDWDMIKYVEPN